MELGKHLDLGAVAQGTAFYTGHHRDLNMPEGMGLIPLGDRNRDKPEYGVDYLEERMSVDKYTKYNTRS